MAACGAIQEGWNAGAHAEGGDLGLTYDASEPISNLLDRASFAAMNFWVGYKAVRNVPVPE